MEDRDVGGPPLLVGLGKKGTGSSYVPIAEAREGCEEAIERDLWLGNPKGVSSNSGSEVGDGIQSEHCFSRRTSIGSGYQ